MNVGIYISLFNVNARPFLEYCSILYSPRRLYLLDAIEKLMFQDVILRGYPNLYNMSYLQRLYACKIDSLELRRIMIDLIMFLKTPYIQETGQVNFKCKI